jgi:hypothetical protein
MIQKFKMPTDLSAMSEPTVEALDGNFDRLEEYLNSVVVSELEGLRKLVAEQQAALEAQRAALEILRGLLAV